MLLHDKRRGGDVAEKHSAGASKLQHIKQELLVSKHLAEIERQPLQPLVGTPCGRQRLAICHLGGKQDEANAQQDDEYALPTDDVGEESAGDRRSNRCYSIDGSDNRHCLCKLTPRELVGGDRPRNHDASRRTNALQKPQCHKPMYCGREYTAYG